MMNYGFWLVFVGLFAKKIENGRTSVASTNIFSFDPITLKFDYAIKCTLMCYDKFS